MSSKRLAGDSDDPSDRGHQGIQSNVPQNHIQGWDYVGDYDYTGSIQNHPNGSAYAAPKLASAQANVGPVGHGHVPHLIPFYPFPTYPFHHQPNTNGTGQQQALLPPHPPPPHNDSSNDQRNQPSASQWHPSSPMKKSKIWRRKEARTEKLSRSRSSSDDYPLVYRKDIHTDDPDCEALRSFVMASHSNSCPNCPRMQFGHSERALIDFVAKFETESSIVGSSACCEQSRLFTIWGWLCYLDYKPTEESEKLNTEDSKRRAYDGASHASKRKSNGVGYGSDYYLEYPYYDEDYNFMPPVGHAFGRRGRKPPPKTPAEPSREEKLTKIIKGVAALIPRWTEQVPDIFLTMMKRSSLVETMVEVCRTTSSMNIHQHHELYSAVLQMVSKLQHKQLAYLINEPRVLYPSGSRLLGVCLPSTVLPYSSFSGEQRQPLLEVIMSLHARTQKIYQHAEANPEFYEEEGDRLLGVCKHVDTVVQSLAQMGMVDLRISSSAEDKIAVGGSTQSRAEKLKQWHRANCVETIEDDIFFAKFHLKVDADKAPVPMKGRMKRIINELTSLQTDLPEGIYIRHASSRIDAMKIIIVGPSGTPYEGGLFEFDLLLPANYPQNPPLMHFMTTGRGRAHFNPNLYADGKVCLSLLGTWSGPGWQPDQSTILQVLVSIQAMIFCDNPWYNEPGRERRQEDDKAKIYNDLLHVITLEHAVTAWIKGASKHHKHPKDPIWHDVVEQHFKANGEQILKTAKSWGENTQDYAEDIHRRLHQHAALHPQAALLAHQLGVANQPGKKGPTSGPDGNSALQLPMGAPVPPPGAMPYLSHAALSPYWSGAHPDFYAENASFQAIKDKGSKVVSKAKEMAAKLKHSQPNISPIDSWEQNKAATKQKHPAVEKVQKASGMEKADIESQVPPSKGVAPQPGGPLTTTMHFESFAAYSDWLKNNNPQSYAELIGQSGYPPPFPYLQSTTVPPMSPYLKQYVGMGPGKGSYMPGPDYFLNFPPLPKPTEAGANGTSKPGFAPKIASLMQLVGTDGISGSKDWSQNADATEKLAAEGAKKELEQLINGSSEWTNSTWTPTTNPKWTTVEYSASGPPPPKSSSSLKNKIFGSTSKSKSKSKSKKNALGSKFKPGSSVQSELLIDPNHDPREISLIKDIRYADCKIPTGLLKSKHSSATLEGWLRPRMMDLIVQMRTLEERGKLLPPSKQGLKAGFDEEHNHLFLFAENLLTLASHNAIGHFFKRKLFEKEYEAWKESEAWDEYVGLVQETQNAYEEGPFKGAPRNFPDSEEDAKSGSAASWSDNSMDSELENLYEVTWNEYDDDLAHEMAQVVAAQVMPGEEIWPKSDPPIGAAAAGPNAGVSASASAGESSNKENEKSATGGASAGPSQQEVKKKGFAARVQYQVEELEKVLIPYLKELEDRDL